MEKKWWVLILILMVILAVVSVFIIIKNIFPKEIKPYYSDDPKTWVEEKVGGVKEINVDKVTKGEGYVDEIGEQYETENIATVFDYEGWYKGKYFKRTYYEKGKKIMSINPEMKPNDDIIEGFVVERIENGIPYIYIFLDDDWRNMIPNTKVYWGYLFQNEMIFLFNNTISKGIYLTKIEDDRNRFENDYSLRSGGVYVGDLREDENSTIINFY